MTAEQLQDALDRAWEVGYFPRVIDPRKARLAAMDLLFGDSVELRTKWAILWRPPGDYDVRFPLRVESWERIHSRLKVAG
jgi:hypothetical protein